MDAGLIVVIVAVVLSFAFVFCAGMTVISLWEDLLNAVRSTKSPYDPERH